MDFREWVRRGVDRVMLVKLICCVDMQGTAAASWSSTNKNFNMPCG